MPRPPSSHRLRRGHRLAALIAALLLVAACAGDDDESGSGSGSGSGTGSGTATGAPDDTEPDDTEPGQGDEADDDETDDEAAAATGPAGADLDALPAVPPAPDGCPDATIEVADGDELADALEGAESGDVVVLADGDYEGAFVITASGTAEAPIVVCGSRDAVLRGDGVRSGYGLHLDHVEHVHVVGFTITESQKGVVVDGGDHVVIDGLSVHEIGDEAIHLRAATVDSVVARTVVRDTGLRRDDFGEGLYVGTAESNWCRISDCEPDRSDRNVLADNDIAATGAESIDIKEGTTGGLVTGNVMDGTGMTGNHADSWIDVKGTGWTITGNTGSHAAEDGIQTHEITDGSGSANLFSANVLNVDGPGFGINVVSGEGNVVACDNEVAGADAGLTNVACA